jgi:hypothetical protein
LLWEIGPFNFWDIAVWIVSNFVQIFDISFSLRLTHRKKELFIILSLLREENCFVKFFERIHILILFNKLKKNVIRYAI